MQEEALKQLRREYARSLTKQMNQAVGMNVALLRMGHGMTQEEFGKALETTLGERWSPQVVSYVERGRRELSPLEMLAIAAVLDEPAVRLLLIQADEQLPGYEHDWTAEDVRHLVLGDDPSSVQPLVVPDNDHLGTVEMREAIRQRIAVVEVEQSHEEALAAFDELHRRGGAEGLRRAMEQVERDVTDDAEMETNS